MRGRGCAARPCRKGNQPPPLALAGPVDRRRDEGWPWAANQTSQLTGGWILIRRSHRMGAGTSNLERSSLLKDKYKFGTFCHRLAHFYLD